MKEYQISKEVGEKRKENQREKERVCVEKEKEKIVKKNIKIKRNLKEYKGSEKRKE